jgi:hypothetical protein
MSTEEDLEIFQLNNRNVDSLRLFIGYTDDIPSKEDLNRLNHYLNDGYSVAKICKQHGSYREYFKHYLLIKEKKGSVLI